MSMFFLCVCVCVCVCMCKVIDTYQLKCKLLSNVTTITELAAFMAFEQSPGFENGCNTVDFTGLFSVISSLKCCESE